MTLRTDIVFDQNIHGSRNHALLHSIYVCVSFHPSLGGKGEHCGFQANFLPLLPEQKCQPGSPRASKNRRKTSKFPLRPFVVFLNLVMSTCPSQPHGTYSPLMTPRAKNRWLVVSIIKRMNMCMPVCILLNPALFFSTLVSNFCFSEVIWCGKRKYTSLVDL